MDAMLCDEQRYAHYSTMSITAHEVSRAKNFLLLLDTL